MSRRSLCAALALATVVPVGVSWPALAAETNAKVAEAPAHPSSEEAIRQALDSKVTLEFQETPLQDLVDFLKELKGIEIQIHQRALADAGIATDTPVTLKISDISLRSALRLALDQLNLTHVIQNEVLMITTPERAGHEIAIQSYDVRDLVAADPAISEGAYDAVPLMELIRGAIAPTLWDSVGGQGSLAHLDGMLVISQQADVQEQIDHLLQAIRKVRAAQQKQAAGAAVWADRLEEEIQPIYALLKKKVSLDLIDTPLTDAAAFLQDLHKIPVVLDTKALEDAGRPGDTPVTLRVKNISLASALRLLLEPHDLTFKVRQEVLMLTTRETDCQDPRARVYPVRDLVDAAVSEAGSDAEEVYADLISAITISVRPSTWNEMGGPGAIHSLPLSGVMVVSQSDEAHEQIDQLLVSIRKLRAKKEEGENQASAAPRKQFLRTVVYTMQVAQTGEEDKQSPDRADELAIQVAKLLPEVIGTKAWEVEGALVRACGDKLVVRQTSAVHKQIERFLGELGVGTLAFGP